MALHYTGQWQRFRIYLVTHNQSVLAFSSEDNVEYCITIMVWGSRSRNDPIIGAGGVIKQDDEEDNDQQRKQKQKQLYSG